MQLTKSEKRIIINRRIQRKDLKTVEFDKNRPINVLRSYGFVPSHFIEPTRRQK